MNAVIISLAAFNVLCWAAAVTVNRKAQAKGRPISNPEA